MELIIKLVTSFGAEDSSLIVLLIVGSSQNLWKSFNNKTVETSLLCSLSQLSTPRGLLENLPASFINPLMPLTQSQETIFLY